MASIDANILLQRTTPDFSGVAQGIAGLGQQRRQSQATARKQGEAAEAEELLLFAGLKGDQLNQAIQSSIVLEADSKARLLQDSQNPSVMGAHFNKASRILGIKPTSIDPIEAEKLVIRREELAARQAADLEKAAVQRETIAARKAAEGRSRDVARQAIQAKIVAAELSNDRRLETQAKIDTNKLNIKRIGELSQGAKGREEAIKKAKTFKRALSTGEATSGTTRTAASFIPGVFSDQGAFDQKFNAFAEVAARQQLKAAGEIRPTDADVEGMKRAMFGIGRDESVNVQLLDEFIIDQQNLDEELEDLREAKSQGRLSIFTGSSPTVSALPPGTVDNGDGTFTLPTGEIVRPK